VWDCGAPLPREEEGKAGTRRGREKEEGKEEKDSEKSGIKDRKESGGK